MLAQFINQCLKHLEKQAKQQYLNRFSWDR